MPEITGPDLPDDHATALVKQAMGTMQDFMAHAAQQFENHRQLMNFWEKQMAVINTFLTQNAHDLDATSNLVEEDLDEEMPGKKLPYDQYIRGGVIRDATRPRW